MRVMTEMPERPSTLVRLPREVDLVLALALAKNPDNRFATATELADALEAALSFKLSRRDQSACCAARDVARSYMTSMGISSSILREASSRIAVVGIESRSVSTRCSTNEN